MYPGFARGLGWRGHLMHPGFARGLGWKGRRMYPGFARGLGWRGRRMCFNNSDISSIADSAVVPARTQTHSFNFLRHVTPNLLPFLVSFMWLLLCFAATAFSVAALTIVFAFQAPRPAKHGVLLGSVAGSKCTGKNYTGRVRRCFWVQVLS